MIFVSEEAAKRMKDYLERRGKGLGIRLGIQTSGCSGMAYVIEYVDELQSDDEVFDALGGFFTDKNHNGLAVSDVTIGWCLNQYPTDAFPTTVKAHAIFQPHDESAQSHDQCLLRWSSDQS